MRPPLPTHLAAEVATLADRHGPTTFVEAVVDDGMFDPFTKTDRVGEVCMVIRRPGGGLLTLRKEVYPPGVMRLPTGGIGHGEGVEAALLREVLEETSLSVVIRQLLAVVAYRAADAPVGSFGFYTFAFLLDEIGGVLAPQDPDERVEAYGEVAPGDLPELARRLDDLEARHDREIGGSWRSWGRFRAVVHRVVAGRLGAEGEAKQRANSP